MTESTNPDDFAERLARARQDDNTHGDPKWDDLGPYDRQILTRRARADLDRMAKIGLRVIDAGADAAMTADEPNLVELLRQRLALAYDLFGDDDPASKDLADAVVRLNAACAPIKHPAVQAMARALLAPVDDPDDSRDLLPQAAADLWALLHNGRRPEGHWDGESQRYYKRVASLFMDSPALRVLLALNAIRAEACEQWQPMVQRILDGELGQEASAAVTHLTLLLADARGNARALERELAADRTPWQVVTTEDGQS